MAPVVVDKRHDPAVVALDEARVHAVSLLPGHLGRGYELARQVALTVGARPVITTADELLGQLALDLLGGEWGWANERDVGLTVASAALLVGEPAALLAAKSTALLVPKTNWRSRQCGWRASSGRADREFGKRWSSSSPPTMGCPLWASPRKPPLQRPASPTRPPNYDDYPR